MVTVKLVAPEWPAIVESATPVELVIPVGSVVVESALVGLVTVGLVGVELVGVESVPVGVESVGVESARLKPVGVGIVAFG